MIVISDELALSADYQSGEANLPLIGYRSAVAYDNVAASTETVAAPAVNLANPSTFLRWTAGQFVDDDYITVSTPDGADFDYLAVAGHNFGTLGCTVSVEAADTLDGPDPDFDEVLATVIPGNDTPLMFRFAERNLLAIRLRIEYPVSATAPAKAAVLYAGMVLALQRKIYGSHSPMTMGRVTEIHNGRSEGGQFLGRIVLSSNRQTSVDLRNLTPTWVRSHLEPFLEAAVEAPFFFAWRPGDYPTEVGYGWLADDVVPVNDQPNGFMTASLRINGIAR